MGSEDDVDWVDGEAPVSIGDESFSEDETGVVG